MQAANGSGYLELVMDNSPDAVFIHDMDGNVLYSNKRAQENLGYTADEIKNLTVMEIDAEFTDLPELQENWRKIGSNETVVLNGRHRRKDQTTFRAEIHLSTYSKKGQKYIVAFVRDISIRSAPKHEQLVYFERFSSLMEYTDEGFYLFETKVPIDTTLAVDDQIKQLYTGEIVECNDAMAKMYGFEKTEDIMGKTLAEMHGGTDIPDNIEFLKAWIENDYVIRNTVSEEVGTHGNKIWFSNNVLGVVKGNQLIRVWGTQTDITELMLTEKELRESEKKFKEFANSMTDVYFALDADLKYTFWNKACEELIGVNSAEVMGKSFYSFEFNQRYKWIADKYKEVIKKQRPEIFELTYEGVDSNIHFQVNVYPLKSGVSVYLQNITDQRKAQDDIQRSLKEKEILLKELYHRTKNNMNVISSLLDLQAKYVDDKQVTDAFSETKGRIRSMALVHQMLYESEDLSRINFKDYVSTLSANLMNGLGAQHRNIDIAVSGADISILLDTATPCGLAINEILTNAFKHAFPHLEAGKIEILLSKNESNEIVISYRDDGIGLPDGFDVTQDGKLGLMNIITIVEYQLKGSVLFKNDNGLVIEIRFKEANYKSRI